MRQRKTPFLQSDVVIVPRPYLVAAGGAVTLRDTEEGVAIESRREKRLLRGCPRWQRFTAADPFLFLIGTLEDEAVDVSRDKYAYLAAAYDR